MTTKTKKLFRPTIADYAFNQVQLALLHDFAEQIAEQMTGSRVAIKNLDYHLLGIEDLSDRQAVTTLLQALQMGDWAGAASHNALAGDNDLLVSLWLHIDCGNGLLADYWIALRSPFELYDWPTLVACGRLDSPPAQMASLKKI